MKVKPQLNNNSLKEEIGLSDFIHRIGHDVGNPLTSLISLASLLERSAPGSKLEISQEDIRKYLSSIINDAWRVQGIMERAVLILSSKEVAEHYQCDVVEIIQSSIRKVLKKPHFQRFDILFSPSEESFCSNLSRSSCEWLVIELLTNALNHLSTDQEEQDLTVEVKLEKADDCAVLTVENPLIAPILAPETLFSPFVKYPDSSKGAGLGLTAVSSVILRANGDVSIDISENSFKVSVLLPLK